MLDMRPVGYVIGLLVAVLGIAMIVPMLMDIAEGRGHWPVFVEAGLITMLGGGMIALACANGVKEGLTIQQTFLLTTGVWLMLPIFGALPFMLGATEARFVDAVFEAMSGMTTTGATVFTGLDDLPKGLLLWRGILQWLGGIGIIIVAMVFLPELRVGGMQIFKSEAFDTFGKILPRAGQIASQISVIYVWLTFACALTYLALGMDVFDATVHALTTVSTGGFSNYDASFGTFSGVTEYAATIFMVLAALPFVRYVQLLNGNPMALHRDPQIRGFVTVVAVLVLLVFVSIQAIFPHHWEQSLRESLFNITSIRAQLQRIRSPHGVFTPRYDGRAISSDVMISVMSFFMFFTLTLGLVAVALSMTGLDFVTSISGAAAALGNIGPGLGEIIGPAGNYSTLNDLAKWILTAAMLIGRLELMAVYVILTFKFWRA